MPGFVNVSVHASQFPEKVNADLAANLTSRSIDPKFHYLSHKQAARWLAVHNQYAPSRTDDQCKLCFEAAFAYLANLLKPSPTCLLGLGCGSGQKEKLLLQILGDKIGPQNSVYFPCDISLPLLLTAADAAARAVPGVKCQPILADLSAAPDLDELLGETKSERRLITFFGLMPNFDPDIILPALAKLLRPGDFLLTSANLAPGPDYAAGVAQVLGGYNNRLTQEWLLTFLLDLGVEADDGTLQFSVENGAHGIKRIVADFHLAKSRSIVVHDSRYDLRSGEKIRLFFSYRHTPNFFRLLMARIGLKVIEEWIIPSGEEGVFLCQRES